MSNLEQGASEEEANVYKVPIKWEPVDVTPQLVNGKTTIPKEAIDSVWRNYVALKGPLAVRNTKLH